jgi:pimeloyl-ACP methyl ester carboxylesterase
MTDREFLGRWRNQKAEARYRAIEDELWARHKRQPQTIDVEGAYGTTRAYHWPGPGDPIVFLHGIGMTSLIWADYADVLADRDVWSIDILGDVGRSVQRVAYREPDDLGVALEDALAMMELRHCHLVGHSLGGWLALNLAVRRPQRLSSLLLLDPVGIGALHMLRFAMSGVPVLLGGFAPNPLRRWIASRFRMPLVNDKQTIRLTLRGQINHPPRIPRLMPFSDDELQSVMVPATVLAGEKTEPFDPDELVHRASELIRHAHVALVPDAGHAFPADHVDLVLGHLRRATLMPNVEVRWN